MELKYRLNKGNNVTGQHINMFHNSLELKHYVATKGSWQKDFLLLAEL